MSASVEEFITGKTVHHSTVLPDPLAAGASRSEQSLLVVFRQDFIGGDATLGSRLLPDYLQALYKLPLPPTGLLFYNTAVRLLTEDSTVIGLLKQLEQRGCELLACNVSLQQLGLVGSLAAGEISTQEIMLERQLRTDRIFWP